MSLSDLKEISAGQFFSITGGLIAGILLAYIKEDLIIIPGLLVLIPGFLEMRGSIFGSLSSRLSSALHMGSIEPRVRHSSFLNENVLAAFMLSVTISVVLGLVSLAATYIFFRAFYIKIILISLTAAIISSVILLPSSVLVCFWLFRIGHDPDNMMGPYVTTIGDIISMISLFLAVAVIA